jgi:hypothetical protein
MPPLYAAPLLAGDAGTAQTIDKIRQLVDDAWKDSFINRSAIDIVRQAGVQQYDTRGQVMALYNWVRTNMYFVNDPVSKEALRPARELLAMQAGDCDDINAILLPALLGSIGHECRLVTIAADARDPSVFSHIYSEVNIDGEWIPIDAARPGAQYGKAPERWSRRAHWSLTDSSHSDYPRLSGLTPGARRGVNTDWYVADRASALGDYADPPWFSSGHSIVQPAIGPGGAQIATPNPSGMGGCGCDGLPSFKTVFLFGLGIGVLWAAFGGRNK